MKTKAEINLEEQQKKPRIIVVFGLLVLKYLYVVTFPLVPILLFIAILTWSAMDNKDKLILFGGVIVLIITAIIRHRLKSSALARWI